jgi:pSer/pThr/pTyr-binding forkhead associated (FHA) protein
MPYLLEALNGPLAGSVFVIENRAIIGRDADVDIQLVQKGVSRQHAVVLTNDSDSYFLMDLASKNGTFLGDESIGRQELKPGDRFRIGETDFLFREGDAPPMSVVESEAASLRLASGPAIGATLDGDRLNDDEVARLRKAARLREAARKAKE